MHHPTDRIAHTTAFVTPVVEHWLEREIAQWVHPMKDRSDDPSHNERTLLPQSYISLPMVGCPVMVRWYQAVCYSQCSTTAVTKRSWCVLILWDVAANRKDKPCIGSSRFPVSLSEWSFTILCQCKWNVLSASLNKTLSSSFPVASKQLVYGTQYNTKGLLR